VANGSSTIATARRREDAQLQRSPSGLSRRCLFTRQGRDRVRRRSGTVGRQSC